MFGIPGVDFQYEAIEQMKRVLSLPVSINGAMMPDAHVGYGMPIGGVAALDHAVSPGFVGYDIACRMTLTILDMSPDEFMVHREQIASDMRAVSSFGKGAGFAGRERRTHPVMDDPLWEELPHVKRLRPLAWQQLGSSGGGNHFFDAVIGEVVDKAGWLPLDVGEPFVAVITHSGSRGTGYKLAKHYVKLAKQETQRIAKGVPSGYEWLDTTTDAGREYLAVMALMGRYAQANHHLIHQHFLKRARVGKLAQYENHHNYAWVQPDGKIIHRKGATPAAKGIAGIIPGTSGTSSYLVEGLGNKESLESSSHGAGRPFSRTEAKRRHDEAFVREWMKEQDVLSFGLAPDESFMAYKDIDHVMALQTDLVRTVARMWPKVVIMGGRSDDGD
jgi:tRNA-splicing ligase RtcB